MNHIKTQHESISPTINVTVKIAGYQINENRHIMEMPV